MGSDDSLVVDSSKSLRSALQSITHPQQKPLLTVLSAILLLSLLHLFADVTWTKRLGHSVYFISGEESDLSNECKRKLDALDRVNDERRAARFRTAKQAKDAGKNVYDMFWKIPVSDNGSSDREERNRRNMIFDLFEPEAVCLTEERFGGSSDERYVAYGDGPKFVCGVDFLRESYKARDQNCLVYSVGSNNNILFEKAVKNYIGCEIHTFDPTLRNPFVGYDYADFHPWGLGKQGEKVKVKKLNVEFTTQSVENVMKQLEHTGRKIDIFKIDCEGCEYEAMPPVFEAMAKGNLQIDQLLIEMHAYVSYDEMTEFFAAADKAGFRITHKERNGWGCNGWGCVEYAFVSRSFLRRATASAIC
ncbi:methyltransferase domain containing protein [Nitzschia inconspicua]|uniref:Methyltransferase domain containing protein n=1 Tax=Nitzschia inconspicua TaxID=303405 RepID=A0A9K3KKT2_9STRA|nr:methyltransferase domain containing protein [Nitzschia inconspicua]